MASRRAFTAGALGAAAASSLVLPRAHGAAVKVKLGIVRGSIHEVVAAALVETLESLEHPVEARRGGHEELFPLLARGEIDLLSSAWLPGEHAVWRERYRDEISVAAVPYSDARHVWAVPPWVPETDVRTLEDLAKPEIAARMADRTLRTGAVGSALSLVSREALAAYGLDGAGWRITAASEKERDAALDAALAAESWLVVPLDLPHRAWSERKLRALGDPLLRLGVREHGVVMASRTLATKIPKRSHDALARLVIGADGVAEMMRLVDVESLPPREAFRAWGKKNPRLIEKWIPPLPTPAPTPAPAPDE